MTAASSVMLYGQSEEIPGEAGKIYKLAKVAGEEKGEFTEALEYLKQAERLLIIQGQENSKAYSKVLVYMAEQVLNISYTKTNVEAVLSCLDKAHKIHIALNDKESEEYINLLNMYGVLERTIGNTKKSMEYFSSVLQIAGQRMIGYAYANHNIGILYLMARKYEETISYFEKALDVKAEVLSCSHDSYINTLCWISQCHVYMQDYAAAEKTLNISDELYQELKKRESHILILHNLAHIYSHSGRYDDALKAFSEVVDVIEKYQNSKKNQSMYMTALNGLGQIYRKLGEFAKAQEIYSKVESFRVREYGENSLEASVVYTNRGVAYMLTSDYLNAEYYLVKSYNIIINNKKSHYKNQSVVCVNLASLYMRMGQYKKALIYAIRSCEIAEIQKKYGEQHLVALSNLAEVYYEMKDYENAIKTLEEAISNNQNYTGVPFVGATGLLAKVFYKKEFYGEALEMWKSAQMLAEEADIENLVKYRMFQRGIIKSYIALNRFNEAWQERKKLGEDKLNEFSSINEIIDAIHTDIELYANLFTDKQVLTERTMHLVKDIHSLIKADLSAHFIYMSELEREFYVKRIYDAIVTNNSFVVETFDDNTGFLYNSCLFSKGLLLNASLSLEKNIYKSGDKLLLEDVRRLKSMKAYLKSTGEDNKEIKTKSEILEKDVMNRCKQKGISTDIVETVTYAQIAQALGKDDVAIEYVRYKDKAGKYRYAASVIRNDWEYPHNIDLCSEDQITFIKNNPDCYLNSELYNLLIKPLSYSFSKKGTLWYSPDGLIHLLGLENLNDDEGMMMSDRYRVMRVTSTREVIGQGRTAGRDMVLFGGIDYNADIEDIYYNTSVSERSSTGSYVWSYLPGTDREVEAIADRMKKKSYDISLFKGDKAMEYNIKTLSGHSPEILHIATHGFYMNNDEMEKAGLVFAGANNSWNSEELTMYQLDDGILTGEEITWLDMSSTDLVVLSACQTGIGNVDIEGMHGLQRAFKRAGARSLMVSLWSVDDTATKALMERFYTRLSEGWDKRDALKDAQKHIKGMVFKDSTYKDINGSNPYYWAAFIIID